MKKRLQRNIPKFYRGTAYRFTVTPSHKGWLAAYINPVDTDDILVGGWGVSQYMASVECRNNMKALGI